MNTEELSPELKALLDSTPVLTESDINELAEANRALARDPEFIADCIKGDFINDILCAMDEQGINRNQLAAKWGKSRQHVGKILDKEKSKNFTIDTIVSLSMTLGLVPQRIELKKMKVPEEMSLFRPALDLSSSDSWCKPDECSCGMQHVAEPPAVPYQTEPENEDFRRFAA